MNDKILTFILLILYCKPGRPAESGPKYKVNNG